MNLPSSELKRLSFSFRTWHVFCVFIALVFNQSVIDKAHAHSGGLNAQGCHAGSQPYHCHSGGSSGSGISESTFSYRKELNSASTVSNGDKASLCPNNLFSELLRQSDHGHVYIKCENYFMMIRSH